MTTRDRDSLGRAARLAMLAGLASTLALSGCDGQSETEAAVHDAAIVLTTGDGSGRSAESIGDVREARYQQAATDLAKHAGDKGYESAAAVLAGLAHQGLAAEAYTTLVETTAEAQRRLTVIRGSASAWRTHRAVAAAATTYDAQPRIATLDELETTLKADLEQAQRVSKLVNEQIAELESRIAEAEANTTRERNVAGELRLESSRKSATEAAAIAERIREHTRRADRYEFEAQRLRTRATQLGPDAAEKTAHIERIQEQLTLVTVSRRGVAQSTQASKRHEAEAMQNAAQTRAQIVAQLDELESYLGAEFEDARSQTETQLRQASGAANKAGSSQDSATLIKASTAQRLAEMNESVAALHASIADALEHMAQIGLDDDGAMARLAQMHRDKESEARDAATDAYADAASNLRRVRVRGQTKDRLNELADRLEGIEPEPTPEDFGADPDDATGDDEFDGQAPVEDDDAGEPAPEDDAP